MDERYFPVTVLGSKLYADGIGEHGPWVTQRLAVQDAATVELLVARVGHRKIATAEELLAALRESKAGLPAIRVWISEGLEEFVRGLWEGWRGGASHGPA